MLLPRRGTQGDQGCARPHLACPVEVAHIRHYPFVPFVQPANSAMDCATPERPMLRPDDDHTRARVMFELVVATATDINLASRSSRPMTLQVLVSTADMAFRHQNGAL